MAEPRPEIWLIRHGETAWSRSGRHTGRTDVPLAPEGEVQSATLGRALAGRRFALVLCSPLGRARDTCRLAGYGDVAQSDADLLEWDYGGYEGRTTAEIRTAHPGWTIWSGGVPNGETAAQVGERAERVLSRCVAAGGDVALFSHAHMLRVLTARWLGLAPEAGRLFALGTASIGVLGFEHEGRVVRQWNASAGCFPGPG